MSSQPTVPGFIPRDDEDLTPAPENLAEDAQEDGELLIQDTEVIDATRIDAGKIAPEDEPQG